MQTACGYEGHGRSLGRGSRFTQNEASTNRFYSTLKAPDDGLCIDLFHSTNSNDTNKNKAAKKKTETETETKMTMAMETPCPAESPDAIND